MLERFFQRQSKGGTARSWSLPRIEGRQTLPVPHPPGAHAHIVRDGSVGERRGDPWPLGAAAGSSGPAGEREPRRLQGHCHRAGAASAAWFSRPRFVDREGAAGQGHAVEGVNGAFCRPAVRHFDEAKAAGAAGLAVGHDSDSLDRAIWLEELAEVLLRGGKGEVAHKNIHVRVL